MISFWACFLTPRRGVSARGRLSDNIFVYSVVLVKIFFSLFFLRSYFRGCFVYICIKTCCLLLFFLTLRFCVSCGYFYCGAPQQN